MSEDLDGSPQLALHGRDEGSAVLATRVLLPSEASTLALLCGDEQPVLPDVRADLHVEDAQRRQSVVTDLDRDIGDPQLWSMMTIGTDSTDS